MIEILYVNNYKSLAAFELALNDDLNIVVGDNEAGKSTILEAINLALTFHLNGRLVSYELSPFIFNKDCVESYIADLKAGKKPDLPKITIEIYLSNKPEYSRFKGTNNSKKENRPGILLEISFNDEYKNEYAALIADPKQVNTIPIEYYSAKWFSFAFDGITTRSLPLGVSYIDATIIRLQTGTDYYLQNAINDSLDSKDKAALSVAYRGLKESFAQEPSIQAINTRLAQYKSIISSRLLNISIDVSQKANWEKGLIPYLDYFPFQYIGRGEQSIIKTLIALERSADKTQVVLIEEPENHLSFSSMSKLIKEISTKWDGKQIILTTHSPYVLNKLGLDKLILLANGTHSNLKKLDKDTLDYFKKLPGFDTLRLILAKRSVLVEGPSDELVVQRAYMDGHGDKLPIEDGIDVISVRALSFKRFLDIAKMLKTRVSVITDNDGDFKKNVTDRYSEYSGKAEITIHADNDEQQRTLEYQLLKANDLKTLNGVFGTSFSKDEELIEYMLANKTSCALKVFESNSKINYPQYITDAFK